MRYNPHPLHHLPLDFLSKARLRLRQKRYSDEMSGVKAEHPGLQEALNFLRSGDTLVVWRLDRLGRSLKHLIEHYCS